MKPEVHAVIGANHSSAAQKENHYDHQWWHEKIFHTAREGLLESRAQKSVSGRKKGPGRLLTDRVKYQ